MQNYIFLDIDGVVYPCHNRKGYRKGIYRLKEELEKRYNVNLDDVSFNDLIHVTMGWSSEAILLLKDLVNKKQAKIIISSSWKFTHSFEVLKKLFALHELEEDIVDMIPNEYGIIKYEAIQKYLDHHPEITSYVILDDIPMDNYFPNHFAHCPDVFDKTAYYKAFHMLK